jgi:hypothetical protein
MGIVFKVSEEIYHRGIEVRGDSFVEKLVKLFFVNLAEHPQFFFMLALAVYAINKFADLK